MEGADGPRAVVVLVEGRRQVLLGTIDQAPRGDLALVDDLLHLQLLARRFGWSIRITPVSRDLRELLALVGHQDRADR